MNKEGKSLNEALKPKLGISGVRRSFHSYYAIFEIQDKGMIKMVYPKLENGDEHTFKTREEASKRYELELRKLTESII